MKTNNKFFQLTLLFVLFTITSCSLDTDLTAYMDEEREKELANLTDKSKNSIVQSKINGSYDLLITRIFDDSHEFFGLKSIHLTSDLLSEDMVLDIHHFFGFDYNLLSYQSNSRRTASTWALFYAIINNCNNLLEEYFPDETYKDAGINATISEIRTMRAIAYYYLVNLYQHSYIGNEEAPAVPLVLSTKDINMPRATVKEVYEKAILKDLEFAIEHGVVTEKKKDTDKAVAAAYAAKVYASMEQWDDVIRCAKIALEQAQRIVPSKTWNIANPGWIWGTPINAQNTTVYASFYSHIDNSNGYAGAGATKSIHNTLYSKIKDSDLRKKFFINKDLFPILSNNNILKKYNSVKYTTKEDFTSDYCYLRAEDPYLLMTEAYIEKKNLNEAKNLLKAFMFQRDVNYNADEFTTQEALREEIRLQRRIELWGEGTIYFDYKRWKKGINRKTGIIDNNGKEIEKTNHRVEVELPSNAVQLIFQIPKTEIENNPNIGAQNPSTTAEEK